MHLPFRAGYDGRSDATTFGVSVTHTTARGTPHIELSFMQFSCNVNQRMKKFSYGRMQAEGMPSVHKSPRLTRRQRMALDLVTQMQKAAMDAECKKLQQHQQVLHRAVGAAIKVQRAVRRSGLLDQGFVMV